MKSKIIGAAVSLLLTLVLVEATCWIFFKANSDKFLFYDLSRFVAKEIEIPLGIGAFDSNLGWVTRFNTRYTERPGKLPYPDAIMSIFGGSFAQGGEVEDQETMAERMSELLGHRVLNFGVAMYSIDQAVLRFEQKVKEIKTPYSMLAFMLWNTGEDVNVYNRFYYPPSHYALTKPRFVINGDNLDLMPNPIQHVEERVKLTDPIFVESLGKHDWWYNRNDLPILNFPYTRILLDPRFWKQIQFGEQRSLVNENITTTDGEIFATPAIADVTLRVLDRFVASAEANGVKPILTILMGDGEIIRSRSQIPQYPTLLTIIKRRCAQMNWICLVPLDDVEEVFPGDIKTYFAPHGHYNAKGEDAMARWMVGELERRNVLRTSQASK
jgi:hypothetical protein